MFIFKQIPTKYPSLNNRGSSVVVCGAVVVTKVAASPADYAVCLTLFLKTTIDGRGQQICPTHFPFVTRNTKRLCIQRSRFNETNTSKTVVSRIFLSEVEFFLSTLNVWL